MPKETSKFIKQVRKWSRILHRDIGFFFVGASIIYGLSGIALNHLKDWNPNYVVVIRQLSTNMEINKNNADEQVANLLQEWAIADVFKTYFFPDENHLKLYLQNNTTVLLDLSTGQAIMETLKRRPVFYHVNFLHYNPNKWWTWFSDIFAGALILFAITSLFMVRGKKGIAGRGGFYVILGIIIPLLILFFT